MHVKDLRIFKEPDSKHEENWKMDEIILVDNASHSFAFQKSNGFPMLPFYDNKEDKEMVYLYQFLKHIAVNPSVNPHPSINSLRANLEKIKYESLKTSKESSIPEILRNTFMIESFLDPSICDQIEGVVEYDVQELSDEDIDMLARDYNIVHLKES